MSSDTRLSFTHMFSTSAGTVTRMQPRRVLRGLLLTAGVTVGAAGPLHAAPILFQATGADAASVTATVDAFRNAVGAQNLGNVAGTGAGRREINWDGGGAAAPAQIFANPMVLFNTAPLSRGAIFTTPGTGLEQSGQPSPEFGEINPTYSDIFTTFSAPRLFAPLGSNVTDVFFREAGTNTPGFSNGFGAIFTDVDFANTTSLEFFGISGESLGTWYAPTFNQGLSFVGVSFGDNVLSHVRIVTGNTALGPNDGGGVDVVAMDDFIYGNPGTPVPEPTSLILLGTGLVGAAMRLRRRVRA